MRRRPTTRVRLALAAALRRRYAYAALRVFRRGLRAALEEHLRRSLGPDPYETELELLRSWYRVGIRRLERRFGAPLPFDDPRSEP